MKFEYIFWEYSLGVLFLGFSGILFFVWIWHWLREKKGFEKAARESTWQDPIGSTVNILCGLLARSSLCPPGTEIVHFIRPFRGMNGKHGIWARLHFEKNEKRIIIEYAHDLPDLQAREAKDIANRLRAAGFRCRLNRTAIQPTENELKKSCHPFHRKHRP